MTPPVIALGTTSTTESMRALVKLKTLLIPYSMKSALNQKRKPTTAPILIPAPMVGEPGRLPIPRVRSALYDSAPMAIAQSNIGSRGTPVAEPALKAYA